MDENVKGLIRRHHEMVIVLDSYLTVRTAYNLMPALGYEKDPNNDPCRTMVWQKLCAAAHDTKKALVEDCLLIQRMAREIEVLRQYGNKDCTAMADDVLSKPAENETKDTDYAPVENRPPGG
jgi:hypothetical protein